MALIKEDGSMPAGANAYADVADADAYFADRGNSVWANLDPVNQKPQYLILGCDYMEQFYRLRWQGYRQTVGQSLCWPRSFVARPDATGGYGPFPYYYPFNSIPNEVLVANCLFAVRVANGDLAPDITRDDMAEMIAIGPIKIQYDTNKPVYTLFRAVNMLINPLCVNSGNQPKIVRA
jgi:hypothetical protein